MLRRIPVSSAPVGRSWHTLTAVSDSSLFLFGGLSVDCKPMSEPTNLSTTRSSILLMRLNVFFSFHILHQVMGGCLMLKQRSGEKSSIPSGTSQGRKYEHIMVLSLHSLSEKIFYVKSNQSVDRIKDTLFDRTHEQHVSMRGDEICASFYVSLLKVVAHSVSRPRLGRHCVRWKL